MVYTTIEPSWFFQYHIIMELCFAVIALAVSIFAFKLYKKISEKSVKFLGISFLLISLSYFIQSIFNFTILEELNDDASIILKLNSVAAFESMGNLVHIILLTIGLVMLLYTTLKEEKIRILFLIILVSLAGILFNSAPMMMFYLLSSIFLVFISWHYLLNYLKKKKAETFLIAFAFFLLLIGNIHLLIPVNHQLFFVVGHFLELVAYLMILTNLYLVLRK
jgi:hypothetical protein